MFFIVKKHFLDNYKNSSPFCKELRSKLLGNYWHISFTYFSSLILINVVIPILLLYCQLHHIIITYSQIDYFLPITVTQKCATHPTDNILAYIIWILLKKICDNCFQLALDSHLHPDFDIRFFPEWAINDINIILIDFAIHFGSTTCSLYLQFNFVLICKIIT